MGIASFQENRFAIWNATFSSLSLLYFGVCYGPNYVHARGHYAHDIRDRISNNRTKDGILLGIPMHVFFAFSLIPLFNEAVSLYLPPDIGKAINKIAVGLRLLKL